MSSGLVGGIVKSSLASRSSAARSSVSCTGSPTRSTCSSVVSLSRMDATFRAYRAAVEDFAAALRDARRDRLRAERGEERREDAPVLQRPDARDVELVREPRERAVREVAHRAVLRDASERDAFGARAPT